ncbi:MAG: 4Fe-4S binding protein [Bacteroidales bacterium]|nr:4Fe-4S binding protein [Bacteroidales bacterium]
MIHIKPEKCTDCLHCARVCPVHAIVVKPGQDHPEVNHQSCIGCGACIVSCNDDAIGFYDSKPAVVKLLEDEHKVAALVDPSISGEFPDITDYRKFVEMIRRLGFELVMDVSFGVDLVARKYKALFSETKGKFYITANCPAIVENVQKFHPELTDNLAPIVSPMVATARVVKAVYGQHTKIVFIGPCIAAKLYSGEFVRDAEVDAVLTFGELRQLFISHSIHESQLEYSDFDPPIGRLGSLYPLSNGILEAGNIPQSLMDGNVITSEGHKSSLKAIQSFEKNIDQVQKNFNIFFNEGCLMGPGMSPGGDKQMRASQVINYSRRRLKNYDENKWQFEMDKFRDLNLACHFSSNDMRLPEPDKTRVDEILTLLDKSGERKGMCSGCGFESCRAFATAVAQGITRTDMCLDFNTKNKNKYIETLRDAKVKSDTEIAKLRKELKERLAEFDFINDKLETSRAIMNQIPSGVVIVDQKLKITSSNRSFIEILGDEARDIDEIIPGLRGADLKTLVPVQFYKVFQNVLATGENILSRDVKIDEAILNLSVFSIKDKKVVGGIVRDMFSPEVRNEQIIQRVTEVIDQNLGMVQQIGFLLGEGASKTEAMLNSIIQLHRKKKRDGMG